VILGVVMGIAAVNLRGARRAAGLESAVVELQQQDRLMRDRSRRLGVPGAMVFDLRSGEVQRAELGEKTHHATLPKFGESAKVTHLRATHAEGDDSVAAVHCTTGRTPSYAVRVEAGGRQQWLVVSGLTGTFEKVDDEQNVDDIFARLARHDAR
jgi:hypothetical protein